MRYRSSGRSIPECSVGRSDERRRGIASTADELGNCMVANKKDVGWPASCSPVQQRHSDTQRKHGSGQPPEVRDKFSP